MKFTWTIQKTIVAIVIILAATLLIFYGKMDSTAAMGWMSSIFVALGLETNEK